MLAVVIHQLFIGSFSSRSETFVLRAPGSILFGAVVHLINRLHKSKQQFGLNSTFRVLSIRHA